MLTFKDYFTEILDTQGVRDEYLDRSKEKRTNLAANATLDNGNNRRIDKSFAFTHKVIDKPKPVKPVEK